MVKSSRRKAAAQPAPQTTEEAVSVIAEYAALAQSIEHVKANADTAIAQIEAARDEALAPLEEKLKARFASLRAWWSVAGASLVKGKRKSIELAGMLLGERTTPRKLGLGNKKAEAVIDALLGAGRDDLVRVKHSLDKPAILKELADPAKAQALSEFGLAARQRDEFFIDRAGPKDSATEIVPEPEEVE